jgi:hypothetical protein
VGRSSMRFDVTELIDACKPNCQRVADGYMGYG